MNLRTLSTCWAGTANTERARHDPTPVLHTDPVAASYLFGCGGQSAAAVVDPVGDLAPYLRDAAATGMRIHYVIDTHLHADHISAGRALAEAAGAPYVLLMRKSPKPWQPRKTNSSDRRVALYLRVSTGGQTTANQRRELGAVAKRHGWKVERVFSDTGISGAKIARIGLG